MQDTHSKNKGLVDIFLSNIRVELRTLDESEEKLVDDLQMRPGQFQNRLVFFRVESVARRVDLRRDGSEQICRKLESALRVRFTYHCHNFRIDRLGDRPSLSRDILQHFMQSLRLDLLSVQLAARVVEIKHHSALLQLLDKQIVSLFRSDVYTSASSRHSAHREKQAISQSPPFPSRRTGYSSVFLASCPQSRSCPLAL